MFQRLREAREKESGFTLIELLVVIIIIAILAAIAIPVFLKQREKGWKSQTESGVKNAATAMESWGTENGGDYSCAAVCATKLTDNGLKVAPDVNIRVVSATAAGYCLEGTHDDLGAAGDFAVYYDSDVGAPKSVVEGAPLADICT